MADKKKGEEKEYGDLTKAELIELLRERNLAVSGTKDKLIERLQEDDVAVEAQAEPEVVESVESLPPRKCEEEDCDEVFVPAKPGYKHCPRCHARWQFDQGFKKVESELGGAKAAFGRYNNYGPAETLFEEAKAYYIAGNFKAAFAALQEASDKTDEVTARGSLEYARRLQNEAGECGLAVDEEISGLADQVEAALSKGKSRQAAWLARNLREVLRPFSHELRERLKRINFVGGKSVGAAIRAKDPSAYQALSAIQEAGREKTS